VISFVNDHSAIDQHVIDARRVLKWIFLGGLIADGRRVEDDNVGPKPAFLRAFAYKPW
jgi:hypothetical protein